VASNEHIHSPIELAVILAVILLGLSLATEPSVGAAEDHAKETGEAQSMDDLFGSPPPEQNKPGPKATPASNAESQAKPGAEPTSVEDLFHAPPAAREAPKSPPAPLKAGESPDQGGNAPQPLDTLFGKQPATPPPGSQPGQTAASSPVSLSGFFRNELTYTYAGNAHWSAFSNMLDLSGTGSTAGGIGWKLGGRVVYDPIYDLTSYYNSEVRDDQRFEAMVRDAYLDYSAGDWDFRLGRQQIVWGEMVGLFFADVVSAKDLRESTLPDFDIIRIPQWAARAEYYQGDFHAEMAWIPYMTYDNIGKPGADFYPFTPPVIPGSTSVILDDNQPTGLSDAAYGLRLSYLVNGWDVSGFYYTPMNPSAAFSRLTPLSAPTVVYEPIHNRIEQTGATLGKDLGPMVLKAEAVFTSNELFSTTRPSASNGLAQQNVFDYIVGLEWSFPEETRFNLQLFQRWFPNYDPDVSPDKVESGYSVLFSTQALNPRVEPQVLLIHSLNRDDWSWSAQFKLTWRLDGNWRLAGGADVYGGPPNSQYGVYENENRVYTELRYNF
jgi:Protein of unknown function (DUF1302)